MHLVGCFYEAYHDARALKHKGRRSIFLQIVSKFVLGCTALYPLK